ncbi:hypothetical protein [Streptomyces mobaraensis]|uniref:Uncharacterized protein n=1 Tax=Streptomyces mobaraensis TaxID=35621 RepID=A0A5N5W1I0_STRMB|nr:hypothetical protein [Streptomyces mobaraensis]KAB7835742.1 hypothetical protein FRZ00_26340 [Streptomyces mobaraensis]
MSVLSATLGPESRGLPLWARPDGGSAPVGRDAVGIAQGLLCTAVVEAAPAGTWDVHELVNKAVLYYGNKAAPGASWDTKAAVGATLLSGQIAARTIQRVVRAHPAAGRDATLGPMVDQAVSRMWAPWKPTLPPSGEPAAGLRMLRHVRSLGYHRDVHPGLEWLAKTLACPSDLYQRHLRRLSDVVVNYHLRNEKRGGPDSYLAQSLTAYLSFQEAGTEPVREEEPNEDAPTAGETTSDVVRMPEQVEEQYLWRLCQHLATHPIRAADATTPWVITAARWSRRAAPPGSDHLLDVPLPRLHAVALEAGLPLPTDAELDADAPACHNALAITLAAFAVIVHHGKHPEMKSWGLAHSAGTGRPIDAALAAATDPMAADRTLRHLQRRDPRGYLYLLRDCASSPHWIDLRTVAALAYTRARRRSSLRCNPTGHWPWAGGENGSWDPVVELARGYHAARS